MSTSFITDLEFKTQKVSLQFPSARKSEFQPVVKVSEPLRLIVSTSKYFFNYIGRPQLF